MAILKRSKNTIVGLPDDLTNLQNNINTEASTRSIEDNKLQVQIDGLTSALTTQTANINVDLANEIAAREAGDTALQTAIATEIAARDAGDTNLNTIIDQDRATVQAIETALTTSINDATARISTNETKIYNLSSEKLDRIMSNFADDAEKAIARSNLDVMKASDVSAAIVAAQINLGTTHTVVTIADRDALDPTTLDTNDNVFVQDMNGDGELGDWAVFKVVAIDATTGDITYRQIMDGETYAASQGIELEDHKRIARIDQGDYTGANVGTTLDTTSQYIIPAINELVAANSALQQNLQDEAIAREAGDNILNQLLDTDRTTFTNDIASLQTAISNEADARQSADEQLGNGINSLGQAIDAQTSTIDTLSTAVSDLQAAGGSRFITEKPIVSNGRIVLTHIPKDGIIFNFATVRYVDINSQAFDATVIYDTTAGDGKTFIVETGGEDWENLAVTIQYAYNPSNQSSTTGFEWWVNG